MSQTPLGYDSTDAFATPTTIRAVFLWNIVFEGFLPYVEIQS